MGSATRVSVLLSGVRPRGVLFDAKSSEEMG
jgi:hypothetical protein